LLAVCGFRLGFCTGLWDVSSCKKGYRNHFELIFQGLPSNSVPLCLTSWENQRKSAKTSEKNCRPPQVWYILGRNFQMPEGTTFICTNSTNTMGPRSRHTAQEGDAFCLLEMNVLWCENWKSIPEQQQRTLWRCWRKPMQKYLYLQ
jgi:hypothetical protein